VNEILRFAKKVYRKVKVRPMLRIKQQLPQMILIVLFSLMVVLQTQASEFDKEVKEIEEMIPDMFFDDAKWGIEKVLEKVRDLRNKYSIDDSEAKEEMAERIQNLKVKSFYKERDTIDKMFPKREIKSFDTDYKNTMENVLDRINTLEFCIQAYSIKGNYVKEETKRLTLQAFYTHEKVISLMIRQKKFYTGVLKEIQKLISIIVKYLDRNIVEEIEQLKSDVFDEEVKVIENMMMNHFNTEEGVKIVFKRIDFLKSSIEEYSIKDPDQTINRLRSTALRKIDTDMIATTPSGTEATKKFREEILQKYFGG
jgi:hypothetical protein